MPQRKFVNQKALVDYAERNGLVYLWAGPSDGPRPCPPSPNVSRCSRQINTRLWIYAHPVVV